MGERELVSALSAQGLFVATAESISAGLVAAEITNVAGSSEVFLGGVVAYQNSVKQELLGVSPQLMAQQGAVDAEVAAQMASGVRQRFAKINQLDSQKVIGVSTTGVAGPGESEGKPQGTVFIGISSNAGDAVYAYDFSGSRYEVRKQTVDAALKSLWEQLQVLVGY